MIKSNNVNIQNFGPINETNIELKPLTVFVGPNSSGKSFAATVINILLNSIRESPFYDDDENSEFLFNFLQESLRKYKQKDNNFYENFSNQIWDYFNEKPTIESKPLVIESKIFNDLISECVLKEFAIFINNKIKLKFFDYDVKNADLNKLINFGKDYFEIALNDICFNFFNDEFTLNKFPKISEIINNIKETNDSPLIFRFDEKDNLLINMDYLFLNQNFKNKEMLFNFIYMVIGNIILNLITEGKSFYMPADRNIGDFTSYIRNTMNNKDSNKEFADNLLSIKYDVKSDFFELGTRLEKEIIGSSINFKNLNNKENFSKLFTLPSSLFSTSIHELVPLFIYFKHVLNKGDTLIIEEPEAHLHPENQRILVKYFVEAINDGLNIIFTTHSDYIIEQINNFIRLGSSSKEIFNKLGYSNKHILKVDDVNIYHFKENEYSSFFADKVDINETGFEDKNFSEIIDNLYNESDLIIDSSR